MIIRLDLSRHCIETTARLRLETLIRSYFKLPDPDTEDRITALTHFLKTVDFQDLRVRISQLEGSETSAVLIISKDLTSVEIRFKNQSIYPAPRI